MKLGRLVYNHYFPLNVSNRIQIVKGWIRALPLKRNQGVVLPIESPMERMPTN